MARRITQRIRLCQIEITIKEIHCLLGSVIMLLLEALCNEEKYIVGHLYGC